jgi:riboflavin kinase/FMN adenylyltransferase
LLSWGSALAPSPGKNEKRVCRNDTGGFVPNSPTLKTVEILRHLDQQEPSISNPVVTMGSFDGLHLGHRALLDRVVQQARTTGGKSVVLTFEPHPLTVLAPARAPRLILSHKDKTLLLRAYGVDVLIIQSFNADFARVEAKDFIDDFLGARLKARQVWVGKDFGFGRGRKGRVEDLMQWGADKGFTVGVMDAVTLDGVRVSSSLIRQLIESGDIAKANRFLGRAHFVSGRVVYGRQRGKAMGFPTANIRSRTEVVPGTGIYATFLEAGERLWESVTSVGYNPTFGPGPKTIECHAMDFSGDLYQESVRLYFVERIREERNFANIHLLVEQIQKDIAAARKILTGANMPERVSMLN